MLDGHMTPQSACAGGWGESVLPACADTHACTRHRPPTQDWGAELFGALKAAGGRAYSNYAVG